MLKHFALMIVGLLAITACGKDGKGSANAAPAATATPTHEWQLGSDYMLIDPRVPTSTGDKIEVVEVFSYACIHCADFQPFMDQLKAKLPANAQVVLVPAILNPSWEPFARAFYAAKSMGVLGKTHQALFDALFRDHLPINDLQSLANGFYASHGVNPANFLSTASSFVIDSEIAHGNQLVRDYGVSGTPTLIVNGKYRVELKSEKHIGPAEAIEIVEQLVKQESAAKK